ncbi:hypothetical protein SeLEV6574_g07937 [Synchytrium endobioticum]|uniref:Uncharacterized protein n=1 Tax=Synchytrium endobioticum TaxID=286115 RepID=A0A507C6S8_9FUNG|nr:hypothetical protein SeLEV6574_g07937 [Synchytrium endobioticum]
MRYPDTTGYSPPSHDTDSEMAVVQPLFEETDAWGITNGVCPSVMKIHCGASTWRCLSVMLTPLDFKTLSKFAQIAFKYGEPARGTIFQAVPSI